MFNFNPDQVFLLKHLQSIEMAKKLDIRYSVPADDAVNLRHSINLDGGIDMIKYLLEFDQKMKEQAEEEIQTRLQQQSGEQLPDSNQSLDFTGQ